MKWLFIGTKAPFVCCFADQHRRAVLTKIDRSIVLFLNYCRSKQLRPKTLQSYEQALGLFAKWLRENEQIEEVEEIKEITIREYMLNLQDRGKYSVCVNARSKEINYPEHRTDF